MNTEKLQRIKSRCELLLSLAAQRTPGKWFKSPNATINRWQLFSGRYNCAEVLTENNAAYIASCAGAAEAGWRSTIAAIDGLLAAESLIYSVQNDYDESPVKWWIEQRGKVMEAHDAIIAAWPEETL